MASTSGTVILTGANGGLAQGFLAQLLKSPHAPYIKGFYTVRDESKAKLLQESLKIQAPDSHDFEVAVLSLSSLENVRAAAKDINERVASGVLPPIRALILNAGVQDSHRQWFTEDGIENTFAVNYLYNFLFVLLLLQSFDKEHGRIIYIGSTAIDPNWKINKLNYTNEEQKTIFTSVDKLARGEDSIEDEVKAGMRRYTMSKVLMVMFMYELQRRLDLSPTLSSISILGLDPGWVYTDIIRNGPASHRISMTIQSYLAPLLLYFWPNHLFRTPAKTGQDLLTVCFDQVKFGEFPKALYIDGAEVGRTTVESRDKTKWAALWEGSVKWSGIRQEDTALDLK